MVPQKTCVRSVCFCNGPLCQAAPVNPAAGSLLLSVVSLSCHIIRSEEAVSPSFQRSLSSQGRQLLLTLRLHQLHRPSDGTSGAQDLRPARAYLVSYAIAVSSLVQRKLVPSLHMRWRITASLRAKATRAFFVPRRFATAIAHALRAEKRTLRVSITLAAS